MDNTTNYQCPACTGPLRFDGAAGKLTCDHCSSNFEVAEIEAIYNPTAPQSQLEQSEPIQTPEQPQQWTEPNVNNGWGEDAAHMRAYNCTSCGAEIICDETTAATSCLYCGNNTIVPGQFEGALRPDYVIPFKLSKEDAMNALKKHCEGKKLLPTFFDKDVHVEEIKGVYVPVWLFDGAVDADVSYTAKDSTSTTSGNYKTTTTKHYNIRRAGRIHFEDIPVDSSSKMPDEYMESIEPFDYSALKPFSMAYMPGFLADKYDVSIETCSPRADSRAVASALAILRWSVTGYSSCIESGKNVNLLRGEARYAMAPVWMLTTRWQNKPYIFAMNGQTGRFVGDLPCDMKKFFRMVALHTPLYAAIAYVLFLIAGWLFA